MSNLFDTSNYPDSEPNELYLGDQWNWRRDDLSTDYPTSSYALSYSARLLDSAGTTEIDITTLDITITPSSTSSAIMVGIGSCPIQVPDHNDNNYWGLKIYRNIGGAGASAIYTNSQLGRATSTTTTDFRDGGGFSFIDKPNTTSQCVYEFRFVCESGSETASI